MLHQKNNWDTEFLLDKIRKKEYTKLKEKPTHTSIFDDDAVADSAVDYLYDNQRKTQSFLQSSGFPSLPDRDFNKQLYGVQEEKRQLRDLLKSKISSISSPTLPNENDRAFLHGLMGEKDGEDHYQKQLSDASRAKDDLLNAFRDTPFESKLKPSAPASEATSSKDAIPETKHTANAEPYTTKDNAHIIAFDTNTERQIPNYSSSKTFASPLKTNAYNETENTVAYRSSNAPSTEVKLNGSALTEEDWSVYDTLQRKGYPGLATDLLFSVEEATEAYEVAGNNTAKKTAARIQAVEVRQNAYSKARKTYVDNYDYTYGAGSSVFLGIHQVAGDNYHTSIIIMVLPDSPLYNTEGFERVTESSPIKYMTLGAGPSFLWDGYLESNYNRQKDRMLVNKVDMINLNVSDTEIMSKLISFEKTYRQNQPLKYDVFPDAHKEEYNSNSFTKGLLNACNIPSPTKLNFNVPGWEKAVPKQYFTK